jgi:glutamate synthase domain-containing protein 3
MIDLDLSQLNLRSVNERLQATLPGANEQSYRVLHPNGCHALAVGLTQPIEVKVEGHVGFYCAGMNQAASVEVAGHAGPGLAENMMSGEVRISGNASQSAGASGHGGLLVVEGDAASRCGISMKGIDIVVGGSIGHFGAFMAQSGRLVVCGDAGAGLGDSIYEATVFVRGEVEGLGADCVEKEMTPDHLKALAALLGQAGMDAKAESFRRYGSARKLYNFDIDHAGAY